MFSIASLSHHLLRMIVVLLAVAFVGLFGARVVEAATISMTPSSGSYNTGQTFTVNLRVDPQGDEVNAVEAGLTFDTTALEVVGTSKDGSVFSLWTTEPEFSNSDGTITFGGGSPSPFTSPSTVLTVTFRATTEGTGAVAYDDVSILAADGLGSDVFDGASDASFTVTAASTPEPTPAPEPEPTPAPADDTGGEVSEEDDEALTFGDPPIAPEVGSQTFLNPDEWYNASEGLFTWSLPFDVDAVAVEIATSSEHEPDTSEDVIYDPPIEEFQVTEGMLEDGVQYLSIVFRNQVGWGTTLNREIKIDTTPPEEFDVSTVQANEPGEFPMVRFAAQDETSGIERYELFIADREPVTITPDEADLGYLLGELTDGTYTVRVVAYDQAGNTREASTPVVIRAGWQPPQEDEEETSFWDIFTAANLTIFFLVLLVILMAVYIWYERKSAKLREEKLRRETKEIQDQMEKIFSALRDEIYDQINTITKRKRLSKSEREAVDGLNQALEVSETLIEKEINDVKSILR